MRAVDVLKEVFLDYNLNHLLDLHDQIRAVYEPEGFLNTSTSNDFINCLMDNMYVVNNNVPILHGNTPESEQT